MRTGLIIFGVTFLIFRGALALENFSFSQCSNAEQTVSYVVFNETPFLTVKKTSGQLVAVRSFHAELLEKNGDELSMVSTNTCSEGEERFGVLTNLWTIGKRVRFTSIEGEPFDSDIVALDRSGKSITVDYICNDYHQTTVACVEK